MLVEISADDAPIRIGAEGAQRSLQHVRMILSTPRGTVPLDREFGISWEPLDQPTPMAIAQLRADVAEQLARYAPGIRLRAVSVRHTEAGRVEPRVTVEILQSER